MVIFKTIRWKNFLATGNAFTEINLDKAKTTLVVGKNGHGKSSFLDAICFALFGKAFRNITKPALVNSINAKNCVVEVEFSIGKFNYKVIRGIKPNIFEIYQNDILINQDSATKDYQKVLEQQLLKFNYRTFTQVVILGSASYVPFMKLPLAARREVIEDILDIKIFSTMNSILKEEMQKSKDGIQAMETAVDMAKDRVQSQQKVIAILEEGVKNERDRAQSEIQELGEAISHNNDKISVLSEQVKESSAKLSSTKKSLKRLMETEKTNGSTLRGKLHNIKGSIDFFNHNDDCVTCSQPLSVEHKTKMIDNFTKEGIEINKVLFESNKKVKSLEQEFSDLETIQDSITDKNTQISNFNSENQLALARIRKLETLIREADVSKLEGEKAKLKEIARGAIESETRKKELVQLRQHQEISLLLLKDGGIKSTIIKEYLPLFNRLINKHLKALDLYVDFEIDETFNERVRSRYRDEFTYASFSEGEKQKIDLALMFTFRQIAKLKQSLSTNLLLMDEVLDGSLDSNGIENVITILREVSEDDTNLFMISHNVEFTASDAFNRVLQFEKKNDFSLMKEARTKFNA